MKENSIEKTIEQLEVILKARKIHKECVGESCTNCNPDIEALTNTIEFLSDYKRLQKENERYQKSDYETICLENKELKEINERLESENQEFLYKYGNVLKENEELKADNYELNNRINDLLDNIPIQKVKDKIEELKKFIYTGENAPQDFLQYRVKAKIQALQELLESED